MQVYGPAQLAKRFNLHSNTIRFYESLGLISRAPRGENGYRQYTDKHSIQIQMVRNLLAYGFTNHRIRDMGIQTAKAVAQGDLSLGRQYAYNYIKCINEELEKAENTLVILKAWAMKEPEKAPREYTYTRKEIAALLGTTVEAVRNWERNGLIEMSQRGSNHEVLFKAHDLDRLRIIYMLRQTGYSMSAIFRCMERYDEGKKEEIVAALDAKSQEELLSAGDCWVSGLKQVKVAAEKIPGFIEEIEWLEK